MATAREPSAMEEREFERTFERRCHTAAGLIHNADVLVVCTGAEFAAQAKSAYAFAAAMDKERNLPYQDICKPAWLSQEPELFYGFWGGCLADYRGARPNTGFGTLARWRDAVNTKAVGHEIRTGLNEQRNAASADKLAESEPFHVPAPAGGFYYCTSNADAHGYDSFSACEIMEVHGNIEVWQCGKRCSEHQWRMPLDTEFAIHPRTMLASSCQPAAKDGARASLMHNMAGTEESQWLRVRGLAAETPATATAAATASSPADAPPAQTKLSSAAQRMMAMRGFGDDDDSDSDSDGGDNFVHPTPPQQPAKLAARPTLEWQSWTDAATAKPPQPKQPAQPSLFGFDTAAESELESLATGLFSALRTSAAGGTGSTQGVPVAGNLAASKPAKALPDVAGQRLRSPCWQRVVQMQKFVQTTSAELRAMRLRMAAITKRANRLVPTPAGGVVHAAQAATAGAADTASSWTFPRCPRCNANARPGVLMFGDDDWQANEAQLARFEAWKQELHRVCAAKADVATGAQGDAQKKANVVILEIGCGSTVMTMRNMTEELLAAVNASGGNAALVRINSHLPLPDNQDMAQHVVSIMSPDGPLPALDEVDNHVTGMAAQQICRASRGLRPFVREPLK